MLIWLQHIAGALLLGDKLLNPVHIVQDKWHQFGFVVAILSKDVAKGTLL